VDRSEGEALVGLLQAYFPRPELPESTVQVWASELEAFEVDDVRDAVRWIAHNRSYPVFSELLDAVRMAWRQRLSIQERVLPARVWTKEDEVESMEVGAKVLADWRARKEVGAEANSTL